MRRRLPETPLVLRARRLLEAGDWRAAASTLSLVAGLPAEVAGAAALLWQTKPIGPRWGATDRYLVALEILCLALGVSPRRAWRCRSVMTEEEVE